MITNLTKEKILETARIEEVIGDFVILKRRGSNLIGLCPFHNERTPSFTVSPAKGFFKCFGCGKAGDSVTFIMEHEHLTFPESLRYLANKYNIEIEEEAPSAEVIEAQTQRESLFIVSSYAQRFYSEQLWETNEGKAIGLTYFRERGFTDETIRKFELGYAPDRWDALTKTAKEEGYQQEYLEKTGLTIVQDNKIYDRFRGRVLFPIHNLTGRVIAFGARILKADPKSPKYLNSPETEIYHKSKSLYGISLAKKTIITQDVCYLVEGYTDVISLHQSGVENVVASSGTSLTIEQIRLIGRYTKNITVLYDGDTAGIKASMRGIDLILEEGLNVRVVLFPEGEDPDSYSRKVSPPELFRFLSEHAVDFISFKTKLLLEDTAGDPIKKTALVRDVVETIAKIPDAISRAAYLRQTSNLMEMAENVLLSELNKLLAKNLRKQKEDLQSLQSNEPVPGIDDLSVMLAETQSDSLLEELDTQIQEEKIISILLQYADELFIIPGQDISPQEEVEQVKVKDFIIQELLSDGIYFSNETYAGLLAEFIAQVENNHPYNQQNFIAQLNHEIKETAISLITPRYEMADWNKRGIYFKMEKDNLVHAVIHPVIYIKKKQLFKMRRENQQQILERQKSGLDYDDILEKEVALLKVQEEINKFTNTVIQK